MEKSSTERRIGLSVLRIIACTAVFAVHFGQRTNLSGTLRKITDCGSLGVFLFFVLSGYLACLSWAKKYDDSRSFGRNVGRYYINRLARLMPLYYFCIVFYFITETFIWKDVPNDAYGLYWLRYIIPLNGLIPEESYFWSNLGITWTIPVFLYFYLLFPLIIKVFNTFRRSIILFIITLAIAFAVQKFLGGFLSAFTYFYTFSLGITAYFAVKEKKQDRFFVLIAIVMLCSLFRFIDKTYGISAVFALLIVALNGLSVKNCIFCKTISRLDEYSYTVYLVHGIVFCGLIDKLDMNRYLTAVIAVVGTVILSLIVHNAYEKPVALLISRLTKKKNN